MDRRTFLKALTSLGASLAVPLDLVTASPAEVDVAWTAATKYWGLFEVDDYGTLSFANFEPPRRRRDICQLPPTSEITPNDIEGFQPLCSHIEDLHFATFDDRTEKGIAAAFESDEDWKQWLARLDADGRKWVTESIDAFLDDTPDWDNEWEWYRGTVDAQGAAYDYFLTEDGDVLDALSIVIIDGDHPGSSYFAAELRMDVDEANRISERLGTGLRFIRESCEIVRSCNLS